MYKTSENLNDLFASLAKAQATIENASKNSLNPHFKSRYADLAEVLNAVREPLSNNGLSVIQTVDEIEGRIYLLTTLAHLSGQFITSRMPLILSKNDCQGLGSALTYCRRYSIAAICGIAQEDDDAEGTKERESFPKLEMPQKKVNFAVPKDKSLDQVEKFIKITAENTKTSVDYIKDRAAKNPEVFWNMFDEWEKKFSQM